MTEKIQNIIDSYKSDYDNISVRISTGRSKSVQLDGREVETVDISDDTRIVVRAVKDGRVASGGFSGGDSETISNFLKDHTKLINNLPSDEFRYIPEYSFIEGALCDESEFDSITTDVLTSKAVELTDSAMAYDSRVTAVKQSSVSASLGEKTIISTAGPVLTSRKLSFSAGAYLIAANGDDERDGYDYVSSVSMDKLQHKESGRFAAENACSLLGAKCIETGKYNILFSANVMADFIELVMELVDGENVYKDVSLLKGRLGKVCASKQFNLTDDPTVKDGVGSISFDDEGQKCDRVEIFKDGMLENYLHTSYTAKALGMENNFRSRLTGGGSITVGSTNVSTKATTSAKPSDICENYLRITEVMGMHTADPVSGNFSVGVSGVYYRGGEAAFPFKEAVLAGNLAELLEGAVHVFDNSRTFGNITTSDTLFDKMSVSGV